MGNFIESAKNKAKQALCGAQGFQEWLYGSAKQAFINTRLPLTDSGGKQTGELDAGEINGLLNELQVPDLIEQMLKVNRSIVCPNTPVNQPLNLPQPQFTGGQCPGRLYSVKIAYDANFGDGSKASDHNNDYFPAGVLQEYGPIPGPINVGEEGTSVYYEWSENAHRTHLVRSDAQFSYQGESYGAYISDVVVTPDDGQPDECGDPEADETDPTEDDFTTTDDVTYEDDDGNPVTVPNVDFTFKTPVINPDGSVSLPVEVCIGDFCFTITIDLTEEIDDLFPAEEGSSCPSLEDIEDLLSGLDRTDEILEKLDEIIEMIEELENNADFTINVFDELKDVISGHYLAFRMMDVSEPTFPRRKKDITTYPYTLSNVREDITIEELKAIEWHRGAEYCWVNPEGVRSKGKLKRGYFSSYEQAQTDLQLMYELTTYAADTAPEFGRSEKSSPQVSPEEKTMKIIQAALYDSANDEVVKIWQSSDFATEEEGDGEDE